MKELFKALAKLILTDQTTRLAAVSASDISRLVRLYSITITSVNNAAATPSTAPYFSFSVCQVGVLEILQLCFLKSVKIIIDFCINRKPVYKFLFVMHCDLSPVLSQYRPTDYTQQRSADRHHPVS